MKVFSLVSVTLFLSLSAFAQNETVKYSKLISLTQYVCSREVQDNDFKNCQRAVYFGQNVVVPMIPTVSPPPPTNVKANLLPGQPDPGPIRPLTAIYWEGRVEQPITTPEGNFGFRIEASAITFKEIKQTQPISSASISIIDGAGNLVSQFAKEDSDIDSGTLTVRTLDSVTKVVYLQLHFENRRPTPMPGITGNN